jgi:NAD(P)-dependent dehydrogenase (short-subunit alcohol dehydrogenase family)
MSRTLCLITGTTSGIGRETARALAADGQHLVMACRDEMRARELAAQLKADTGNDAIETLACDLSSLASVRRAAAEFRARHDHLDLLINNAGTMTTRFQRSVDGLELTFAANYLGPWLLTRLLLDSLVAGTDARIVTVASAVHLRGSLDPVSLEAESARGFSGMAAYARSKLGNVMATFSQAELLREAGVTANCLHPGVVGTNITSDTNALLRIGMKLISPFILSETRGAATSLYLARDPSAAGSSGGYYDENQRVAEPHPTARDQAALEQLWAWSSDFCGIETDWQPGLRRAAE